MFNQIILAGRVSIAPQMINAGNFKKCIFHLAVQKPFRSKGADEYGTDFFRITCWAGLSERIMKDLKVGNMVIVKGRLDTNNYKNKDGVMVYESVIVCEKAIYLNPKDRVEETKDQEEETIEE